MAALPRGRVSPQLDSAVSEKLPYVGKSLRPRRTRLRVPQNRRHQVTTLVVVRRVCERFLARQVVKDVASKKIGFIKVWVTSRNGSQKKTTPEAYRALIDEAHKHDIKVVAHATDGLEDVKDLARAGLEPFRGAARECELAASFAPERPT